MRLSIATMMITSTGSTLFDPYEPTKHFMNRQRIQEGKVHAHIRSRNSLRKEKPKQPSMTGRLRNFAKPIECALQNMQTESIDLGILSSCPPDSYCLANPESSQGGFCQHRHLQDIGTKTDYCNPVEGSFERDASCDCSSFDYILQKGSFVCRIYGPDHCFQDGMCGSMTLNHTLGDNETVEYCYEFVTPMPSTVCYRYSIPDLNENRAGACSIHVDGVTCNFCRLAEIDGIDYRCNEMDCNNTLAGVSGIDCLGGDVVSGLFEGIVAVESVSIPTASPTLSLPRTAVSPNATLLPDAPSVSPMDSIEQSNSSSSIFPSMIPSSKASASPFSSTAIPSGEGSTAFSSIPSRMPTLSMQPSIAPTSFVFEPTNASKYSLTARPIVPNEEALDSDPPTSTSAPTSTQYPTLSSSTTGNSNPTRDPSIMSSASTSSTSAGNSHYLQKITLLFLVGTAASVLG